MKKTKFVVQQELSVTFKRPSFLVLSFGIPIVVVLVFSVLNLIKDRSDQTALENSSIQERNQLEAEGIVDYSGLIEIIPADLGEGKVIFYDSEKRAQTALSDGEISAYYVIPADYLQKGKVDYVYPDSKPYFSDGQEWVVKWLLLVNMVDGDIELADQVWNPIWQLQENQIVESSQVETLIGDDCSRPGFGCQSNDLIRYIPSAMVALFFIIFLNSSNLMFNSIGTEKENRTIEVLLTSIEPRQFLAGKTIAVGLTGLIQMCVWLGTVYLIFKLGGGTLKLPENFVFPTIIFFWSILFFLGGFSVYAVLMAGVGAMVPRIKEAGAANFIAIAPLMLGYVVGLYAPIAGLTDNVVPVVLSYFPLTSPVLMVMRLTDGVVPTWQLVISSTLLFISAFYILRVVSRMFRAQILLSGQSFSITNYLKAFVILR